MRITLDDDYYSKDKSIKYNIVLDSRSRKIKIYTKNKKVLVVVPGKKYIPDAKKFLEQNLDYVQKVYKDKNKPEDYYLLGRKLNLERQNKNVLSLKIEGDILKITASENIESKEVYLLYLRKAAKRHLKERFEYLRDKYKFKSNKLSFRAQVTRWGSCSYNNNISLNIKLLCLKPEIIDYVIIHELCHTVQHNHSAKFWEEVEKIIPDYKERLKELKKFNSKTNF